MKKSSIVALCATVVCAVAAAVIVVNRSPKKVDVADVSFGDFTKTVEISGKVAPSKLYTVMADGSGRVSSVAVKEGQTVKTGDPLFSMDDKDILDEIKSVQRELEQAKSEQRLALAEQSDAAQVMGTQDNSLEASVNESNDSISRAQNEGIDYQTYNDAIEAVHDAMAEQTMSSDEKDVKNAVHTTAAVKAANSRVKLANARIKELENSLGNLLLSSAAEGTIINLNIKEGEIINPGTVAMEIADTNMLNIVAAVDDETLRSIRVGQRAQIWQNEQVWKGTVVRVSPQITLKSEQKMGEVEIQPDPGFTELIGEDLDVSIVTEQASDVCMISTDCVAEDEDGYFVLAVEGDKLVKRTIETGMKDDFNIVVLDGLQVGEQAALYPEENLGYNRRILPIG